MLSFFSVRPEPSMPPRGCKTNARNAGAPCWVRPREQNTRTKRISRKARQARQGRSGVNLHRDDRKAPAHSDALPCFASFAPFARESSAISFRRVAVIPKCVDSTDTPKVMRFSNHCKIRSLDAVSREIFLDRYHDIYASGSTLPGFMMPLGSSACLIRCMRSMATSPS